MKNPLVSVIIPVYNAELYVEQCINSVLSQTYNNIEVLAINDGSSDASSKILDNLSCQDRRIRVIHKVNTGVSDTRNIGIDESKGEYLIFLDSDDYWVNNHFLANFVMLAINNQIDIVRGEYTEVNVKGEVLNVSQFAQTRAILEKQVLDNITFLKHIVKGEYFSVLCLYKKTYISALRFNKKRVFLEDAEFYISLLSSKGRFLYIADTFYAYRKHSDAVSVKLLPQKMKDAFDFSRFCFIQARMINQHSYKKYCALEGLRNYLYDISQIADDVCMNRSFSQCNKRHNLSSLRKEVIGIILKFKLFDYLIATLPIIILVRYYYIRHRAGQIIRGFKP